MTNTVIPCKLEGMASQKSIQFTVLNIRKKGWIYAPWYASFFLVCRLDLRADFRHRKKPAKNAKTVRDDNTKELFENGEWARNGACFSACCCLSYRW